MLDIILNLLSILNGYIYTEEYKKLVFINNNQNLIKTVKKLYNIGKNDKTIPSAFINKLKNLITNNNYYESITEILFYIILEKKQPIYIENLINETIENILINTKNDAKIEWLTTGKAMWRFMTAGFNKRDFFKNNK